jgi:predicted nucleotidyltransferase
MDMARQQRLEENLNRIVGVLKNEYRPQQIIVYGSYASGEIHPTSDLDILIVKETDKSFYDRLKEVTSLVDYTVGVDFLVYTPHELEEEARQNPFVRNEILGKGKVVFREAA